MNPSIPSFHDGNLTGIRLDEKLAILSISRVNGEQWEIAIAGVQALRMDEFLQGNILYGLEIIHGARPPREVLERLFPSPHPSAAKQYHDAYTNLIDAQSGLVSAGKAVLVIITPSYGAEFAALGSEVAATQLSHDRC